MLVALVEDDPMINGVLAECLEDAGYRTETVQTAGEAFDLIERRKADLGLLITDIRIHSADNKTGWDVADFARRHIPGLPIIYMSGDSAFHRRTNGLPNSVFLTKPFRVSELLACLREVLNRGSKDDARLARRASDLLERAP